MFKKKPDDGIIVGVLVGSTVCRTIFKNKKTIIKDNQMNRQTYKSLDSLKYRKYTNKRQCSNIKSRIKNFIQKHKKRNRFIRKIYQHNLVFSSVEDLKKSEKQKH